MITTATGTSKLGFVELVNFHREFRNKFGTSSIAEGSFQTTKSSPDYSKSSIIMRASAKATDNVASTKATDAVDRFVCAAGGKINGLTYGVW